MKLWKRTQSDHQVGGRPSSSNCPKVSTNPNGAEDARSLRLGRKANSSSNHKNNNNNIANGASRCQEKCWAKASRRSLQHLPGLLRASPEPWSRASPDSSPGLQGFSSLPYYFPNNLTKTNHHHPANLYNHSYKSNFSSLPIRAGSYE